MTLDCTLLLLQLDFALIPHNKLIISTGTLFYGNYYLGIVVILYIWIFLVYIVLSIVCGQEFHCTYDNKSWLYYYYSVRVLIENSFKHESIQKQFAHVNFPKHKYLFWEHFACSTKVKQKFLCEQLQTGKNTLRERTVQRM